MAAGFKRAIKDGVGATDYKTYILSQETFLIGGGDAPYSSLYISLYKYLSRLDDLPMDGDRRSLQDDRQPWANLLVETRSIRSRAGCQAG